MRCGSMLAGVAQAIATAQGSNDWWNYIDAARSAIGAMREPSTGMLEAVLGGLPDWGTLPDDWKTMIDHALGEILVHPKNTLPARASSFPHGCRTLQSGNRDNGQSVC